MKKSKRKAHFFLLPFQKVTLMQDIFVLSKDYFLDFLQIYTMTIPNKTAKT